VERLFLAILFLCAVPFSAWAEQPPEQQWVDQYNGLANRIDKAYAADIDNSGNVCVTGRSDTDPNTGYYYYTTIKYDSEGNQLWLRRYTEPLNVGIARDIAIDDTGNICVTGYSSTFAGLGYATIKYDPNGNQLWVSRYDGANRSDYALAIALDGSGNVYVTGHSYGGSVTGNDCATVKYDSNGNELWVARYNGPRSRSDKAELLEVDDSGNVYIAGFCDYTGISGQPNWGDVLIIKYDSNGNELWTVRCNGIENSDDFGEGLCLDGTGNVYVLGRFAYGNYKILKYDPNGNELWGTDYLNVEARAIAVDGKNNLYVTGGGGGSEYGDEYTDYETIKFDPNGNMIWSRVYDWPEDGADRAEKLVVDNSDYVYISGEAAGTTDWDYATVKYDPNGNVLWAVIYNNEDQDLVHDLAVDNLGNVCITGYNEGSILNTEDFLTVKYTQHDYCVSTIDTDFNGNCKVDFFDFSILGDSWLIDYDFLDLAILAEDWLKCNFALEEDCL